MTEQHQSSRGIGSIPLVVVLVVAVLGGMALGLLFYGGAPASKPMHVDLRAATLLPHPKPLQDFTLTDQDRRPLGRDAFIGHWTFLSFGYTHCPDICPTLLANYAALEQELAKSGAEQQPDFLFVSVDPERDTPERIGEYVRYFNPRIRGATAGHDVLQSLASQLGILYQRSDSQETAMGYLVDHSASILLLDPEARLTAIFSLPHDPKAMAEDFRTITTKAHAAGAATLPRQSQRVASSRPFPLGEDRGEASFHCLWGGSTRPMIVSTRSDHQSQRPNNDSRRRTLSWPEPL
jgi:protein SCO1/2